MAATRWTDRLGAHITGWRSSGPARNAPTAPTEPARSTHRRHRGVLAIFIVALPVLAPALAEAHDWQKSGMNGAQLNVSPDGYPGGGTLMGAGLPTVQGRKFAPSSPVLIFQCRAGETNLFVECQRIGAAQTTATGAFTTSVPVTFVIYGLPSSPAGLGCVRQAGTAQCAVVAATFDPVTQQPSSMAEHYICFGSSTCTPGPTDPEPTTTSSTSSTTSTTTPPRSSPNDVADFDGNGSTDVSVFRPSDGTWYVKDGTWSAYGANGDIPVPADYDGDGHTDMAIFRPSTALWAIHESATDTDTFFTYGISTDVPIPADYDGDGRADVAVFRPEYGTWWYRQSSTGADVAITFGISTDVPVPADYDGDDRADLGIFRDGAWYVQPAAGGSYTATTYGAPGDIPAPGDYDGDGKADTAVFGPSNGSWAIHHSANDTDEAFALGSAGDIPVPGDYDGDGRTDAAVFHRPDGTWHFEDGSVVQWGNNADIPLPIPYSVRRTIT